MRIDINNRLLLALVLTNPFTWALAGLVLLVLTLVAVLVIYLALYLWLKHELSIPQKAPPVVSRPPEPVNMTEDRPISPPAPGLVVTLDEHGRAEVLVDEVVTYESEVPTSLLTKEDKAGAVICDAKPELAPAAERKTRRKTRPTKARTKPKPSKAKK